MAASKAKTSEPDTAKKAGAASFEWFQLCVIMVGLICMGAALGFERSLLPRMAVVTFGHTSVATILNFVASFGLSKAVANVVAGPIADKFGRKITLILGFVIGLPVMPYINFAQSWTGITVMNIAFGFSQGLLGSALFFLLIDVLGPSRRGIAVGMGECTIYVSTAILNVVAGDLASRFGFRPVPFWVATGFAVVGLLSTIPLHDTLDKVKQEQSEHESRHKSSSRGGEASETDDGLLLAAVRRDSDSSSEGTIASRATFPFEPDEAHNHLENGDGHGRRPDAMEGLVFRTQDSGYSTGSENIASRAALGFEENGENGGGGVEPRWIVADETTASEGAGAGGGEESIRTSGTAHTTHSATSEGISLPALPPSGKPRPGFGGGGGGDDTTKTIPYGTMDDPAMPSQSQSNDRQPAHHHRTRTPIEEYRDFECRMSERLGRITPPDEPSVSSAVLLQGLAPKVFPDETKALLAKGGAGKALYSFDSSSSSESDDEDVPGGDPFVKKMKEQEAASGGTFPAKKFPEPPLAALGRLLANPNFAVLCFCGMIMNFKDGFAWGSFPIFFSDFHNLSDDHTDMLVALYPLCWGFAQAFTGALSDLYGRRLFLLVGIGSCTLAVALYALPGVIWGRPADDNMLHVYVWGVADVLLGLGTACAYPALQAGAADEIDPVNRGLGLGFYRFIRDMGYVVGALICGRITDAIGGEIGYAVTFLIVAAVMGTSLLSVIFVYSPVHWSERMWKVT